MYFIQLYLWKSKQQHRILLTSSPPLRVHALPLILVIRDSNNNPMIFLSAVPPFRSPFWLTTRKEDTKKDVVREKLRLKSWRKFYIYVRWQFLLIFTKLEKWDEDHFLKLRDMRTLNKLHIYVYCICNKDLFFFPAG